MNEPILLDSISDKAKQASELSDSNACDQSYLKADELAILGDCRNGYDHDTPQRLSNEPILSVQDSRCSRDDQKRASVPVQQSL